MSVLRAVVQHQFHFGFRTAVGEFTVGKAPTDFVHDAVGLRHVHVNGIQLLHHRQPRRLVRRHESTRRHFRQRHLTGNRALHLCVAKIDAGGVKRGPCGGNVRFRHLQLRLRLIV